MDRSETIGELAKALAAAQAVMDFAQPDSDNPAFKRGNKAMRYPSLRSVIEAARPALTANGLSVVQTFEPGGADLLLLTTALLHSSGEWVSGTCSFPVERPGPQGYASASTYARRYALMAIVGLAPDDDDDANAASAGPAARQQQGRGAGPESAGDRAATQAPPVSRSEREELIGQVHALFKQGHEGEKFYPWASGVLKREIGQIGDMELADLKHLHRHLTTEAAVAEGQARQMGQKPAQAQGA